MTTVATSSPPAAAASAADAARTFIRAVEVWGPSDDGTLLELAGGLFGDATRFGTLSRTMCFGRGEGLPGRVWDEGQPLLLKNFKGSYFRRVVAAEAAGLTCGIAVPWFRGGRLTAVLVLFCGDVQAHAGAIELWRNDPRITGDMTLADGYYGTSAEALETLSRETYLPRGAGLPGLAWQRGTAVFIDDLGASTRFLRADVTAASGIHRGLAFPCATPGVASWVISFLSASETPVALRTESWVPAADAHGAVNRLTLNHVSGLARPPAAEVRLDQAPGAIGRAFQSGVPIVCEDPSAEPGAVGNVAAAAGHRGFVALPILHEDTPTEVVVLWF